MAWLEQVAWHQLKPGCEGYVANDARALEPTRTLVKATMVVMVWPVLGCVMTDPTSRPMDCATSTFSRTADQLAKKAPGVYLQHTR